MKKWYRMAPYGTSSRGTILFSKIHGVIAVYFGDVSLLRPIIWIATRGAAFAAVAVVSGCASLSQSCMSPARMMASAEMVFGRNIGDRPGVSEIAFADFVTREISPRFPDGLTVIDGNGLWHDSARGSNVRERAKIVLLTFADDVQKRADLVAIADSYKLKFSQQSVLIQVRTVCASF